jgi:hypothetical protein
LIAPFSISIAIVATGARPIEQPIFRETSALDL